jgi:hypothetical protein
VSSCLVASSSPRPYTTVPATSTANLRRHLNSAGTSAQTCEQHAQQRQ